MPSYWLLSPALQYTSLQRKWHTAYVSLDKDTVDSQQTEPEGTAKICSIY